MRDFYLKRCVRLEIFFFYLKRGVRLEKKKKCFIEPTGYMESPKCPYWLQYHNLSVLFVMLFFCLVGYFTCFLEAKLKQVESRYGIQRCIICNLFLHSTILTK